MSAETRCNPGKMLLVPRFKVIVIVISIFLLPSKKDCQFAARLLPTF
jgi:hypothetical protein